EGWAAGPGFRSCAHWLSWRTGIAPGAAREKVRVARALAELPQVSAAMRRGELSYAKVRALTRVARPESEGELLELARRSTAAQLERVVRAWRRVDRLEAAAEAEARHEGRRLVLHVEEDGTYVLRARLEPEAGAVLERALVAAEAALYARVRRQGGERRRTDSGGGAGGGSVPGASTGAGAAEGSGARERGAPGAGAAEGAGADERGVAGAGSA